MKPPEGGRPGPAGTGRAAGTGATGPRGAGLPEARQARERRPAAGAGPEKPGGRLAAGGDQALVPDALRERIAGDPFCRLLGIRLEDLQPGYARLAMTVQPEMLNFHGSGHGGAVFALADAAHAAASNSHGVPAVALHVALHYVSPAQPGDELVAEAWEEHRGRRTALYRLEVRRRQGGRLVAAGHGRVFRG